MKNPTIQLLIPPCLAVMTSAVLQAGAPPVGATMTKQLRDAITPAEAFERLQAGNERFASGIAVQRDLLDEARTHLINRSCTRS